MWLALTGLMLSILVGGATRVREARAILVTGWQAYLQVTEPGEEVEVEAVARGSRSLVILLFGFSLVYWLGVIGLVHPHIGLAGALLYLAELMLNLELLEYLISDPNACFSPAAANRVLAGYYLLAAAELMVLGLTAASLLAA